MRLNPSKVVEVVLAAAGSMFTWLLVWGVSAASARPSTVIYRGHHLTTAQPSTATVVFGVVLLAAVVCAGVAFHVLSSRRKRRAASAQVRSLAIEHEREQKRKAA
jgi:mannitol-specific phosphotransferase system IIBC component